MFGDFFGFLTDYSVLVRYTNVPYYYESNPPKVFWEKYKLVQVRAKGFSSAAKAAMDYDIASFKGTRQKSIVRIWLTGTEQDCDRTDFTESDSSSD